MGSLADIDVDQVSLTPNLSIISDRLYRGIKETVKAFRKTLDGRYIVAKVPTDKLTPQEICMINQLCDHDDPQKNAEVKKIIAGTIDGTMGPRNFQLVEFGGGYNLLPTNAVNHHVLEIDPKIIKAQKERGISASTYDDMAEGTLRTDCPRIAPAIYCFHFMNPGHTEQIGTVISHDGFFIANCMKTHSEETRKTMMDAFAEQGLKLGIVSIDTEATKQKVGKAQKTVENSYGEPRSVAQEKLREYRAASPLNNEFWVVEIVF